MTAPEVEPRTLLGPNYRGAIGDEPLLQYDFVPCPARTDPPVGRAAQAACPGAPPPVVAATPPIIDARTTVARLRDGRIGLRVACQRAAICRGRLRQFDLEGAPRVTDRVTFRR